MITDEVDNIKKQSQAVAKQKEAELQHQKEEFEKKQKEAELQHQKELEAVKEYWRGQESDGWGEGFEQRPIQTLEGELYVSFWNSGNDFFIATEEQLKGLEQESDMQMGGM